MNLVGEHGRGESVWLGFFLYDVLTAFTGIARAHGDTSFADQCAREAARLRLNIENHGWTWYTGSAAWMYRLIVESLLGLSLEVDKLRITPCLPADWEGFKMHYRYRETVYHIEVLQTPAGKGGLRVTVDGIEQPDNAIPLVDDHREHWVEVKMPVAGG